MEKNIIAICVTIIIVTLIAVYFLSSYERNSQKARKLCVEKVWSMPNKLDAEVIYRRCLASYGIKPEPLYVDIKLGNE